MRQRGLRPWLARPGSGWRRLAAASVVPAWCIGTESRCLALCQAIPSRRRRATARRTPMLYQAYQTQADWLGPLRPRPASAPRCSAPRSAVAPRCSRRSHAQAGRRLRSVLARAPDAPAARLRHRLGAVGEREVPVQRGSGARARRSARCCASAQGPATRPTPPRQGADRGADVGPLRHAAARHRAHHAARPRRLHHRLAQRARRAAVRRPLRARRIHRAPHRLPRRCSARAPTWSRCASPACRRWPPWR